MRLLAIASNELFGVALINLNDLSELTVKFLFNLLVVSVIIRFVYYKYRQKKEFLFSYFAISTVVFLLCFLLESVKIELGFAIGLFAIFGIIRYRTRQIPIREMTYLFIVIGISVINALANKKISYAELIFTNFALTMLVYILERVNYNQVIETNKIVLHEKIDVLDFTNEDKLKDTLAERTGLDIIKYRVGTIDYAENNVEITIYYRIDES